MSQNRDRGAAAVEFASVLPVPLVVLPGIVELGPAYIQTTGGSQCCSRGCFTKLTDRDPTFTCGGRAPQLGAGVTTPTK